MEPGDLVRLKSGGPVMTVDHEQKDGDVICVWFVNFELKSACFKTVTLEPWSPPKR